MNLHLDFLSPIQKEKLRYSIMQPTEETKNNEKPAPICQKIFEIAQILMVQNIQLDM